MENPKYDKLDLTIETEDPNIEWSDFKNDVSLKNLITTLDIGIKHRLQMVQP